MFSKLSPPEMALVLNTEWLYMKQRILEKAMALMGEVQVAVSGLPQWERSPAWAPALALGAKVSKGERYKDLPYVILDHPRLFSRDDIFALRTMFWWGHDFTATLHLAGVSLARHHPALLAARPLLEAAGAYLYLPDDPWQHEISEGIYRPLAACSQVEWEYALGREFLKLARPFALEAWERMVPGVVGFYAKVLDAMSGDRREDGANDRHERHK